MCTLFIKNDNIKVKVPKDSKLRTIATKTGSSMQFGCRVGDCGTCLATVEQGIEYLNPKTQKEITLLEIMGSTNKNERLLCQATIISDEGEVTIWF